MRILLLGEYSRFHNSLKEGLVQLGHEVVIAGNNDFKNYPLDISLFAKTVKGSYAINKFRQLLFRLFKYDIAQTETALRFYCNRKKLSGFDIVQLVNEYPIESSVALEIKMLQYIFGHNKKAFVSSSGDDFTCISYMLAGKFRYSTMTPCFENPKATHCQYSMRYVSKPFVKLHEFVFKNVAAVIPADLDYAIPLENHPKAAPLIPYPINIDKLVWKPLEITGKIIVFHGISDVNYYKKGNNYFEEALQIIAEKYPDQVEIITTRSLPYERYIKLYDSSHIVLDQVLSYDQGYNALEAMAKGKVVFTGAEAEFESYYNIIEPVNINAKPDVPYMVQKLSFLIENPQEIVAIGKRARDFVEKQHHYVKIAEKYLKTWNA